MTEADELEAIAKHLEKKPGANDPADHKVYAKQVRAVAAKLKPADPAQAPADIKKE